MFGVLLALRWACERAFTLFCKRQLLLLKVGVYTARADFKMWIHRIMWATLFEIKGVLRFNHVKNHIGCKP